MSNQIQIGRFLSNERIKSFYPRHYGQHEIPARSIRWLGHYIENSVSTRLSEKLRHSHPFTLLESSLFPEVFSLAFGSFSYGELKASTVYSGDDFLDTDSAFIGNISRLAATACAAIDNGDIGLGRGAIVSMLLSNPPIQYTCTQEVDIHSPGFNRFLSVTIVPLVISALIASFIELSKVSSPTSLQSDVQALHYVNSASNADPHVTAMVSEASKRVLQSLGVDNTWAICEAAKAAHDRAGLRAVAGPKR